MLSRAKIFFYIDVMYDNRLALQYFSIGLGACSKFGDAACIYVIAVGRA